MIRDHHARFLEIVKRVTREVESENLVIHTGRKRTLDDRWMPSETEEMFLRDPGPVKQPARWRPRFQALKRDT